MWKESYRLGVESIDRQHMELFHMTDELLRCIEKREKPARFRKAVSFLKEFSVEHFRDEEAYQASIHYAGMEEHVKQHKAFADTVLSFERRLEESEYSLKDVKDLAGMLTAWLIYHVSDMDQRIVGRKPAYSRESGLFYTDCFGGCVRDVLVKMTGLDADDIHTWETGLPPADNTVAIQIGLTGDLTGNLIFGFSESLAFKLFESMTFMTPAELDELVCSALAEIANIAGGNVATVLSQNGLACDIRTPQFLTDGYLEETAGLRHMRIATSLGDMDLCASGLAKQ